MDDYGSLIVIKVYRGLFLMLLHMGESKAASVTQQHHQLPAEHFQRSTVGQADC